LCFYQQHQNTDLWSKVKLKKFTSNTPSTITANAEIYDIKGEIIATVTGITLQKINHKLNSDVPVWNDWLYQIIWQEQSLNINNCLATTQENYLIVTADSKLGNKIVSALKNQHQECSLIYLNKEHQKITDCHYSLNSDIAAEYNIVYQKITKTCSPDKIIYLAALDNNNTETIALSQASQLSEIVTKQCSQLLFLTQTLIQNSTAKPPRLYIVTNNHSITQSPLWGMGKTIALEYPELNCTLYDYDALDTEIQPLLIDICNPTEETQIVYRHGKRQVARLVKQPITKLAQKLIISDRGTLANLQWKTVTPQTPQKGEVTIQVVATGLNFRDVLNTLNMYPKEAGELGLECSGVITAVGEEVNNLQVGDKVLAIATGSFSSYVTVNAHLVIPLPSSLSFTEAATIPTAFLTAYYCLHHLAAIKPGDKILIHSAAGGVGLAAVQICQQIGAEIFATASPSKWQYLQTLGINHIMNSRNLDFAEEILSITQGEGINIVLNSLAGEYIPKSLAVLKPQGCFIEIGKNDLWNQNQVSQIKPQVTYHKTDLFSITQEQPQLIQTLLSQLISQFANKTLQPLKYTTFSDSEIVTAFRYMQQAKHIGKIVILNESVNRNLTISSESSYLITGGLGALGLEVAQWLVSKGAKHLLLVGRNQPSAKAKVIIKQLETTGATIQIIQGDIANPETIDQIFFISDYPLKGIIHAAGVIQDKTILNQTPEDFQAVINPKILGVWNLHQATQNLPLDFFVMFSSAASLLGSPGQINYAAANAFLDSFAHYRHSLGLPALSINWSAWNDLGLAATNTPQTPGMQSILPQEGIAILESLLTSSLPQVGVLPIDSKQWQINSPFSENFQQTLTKTNFRDTLNNLSETEVYHQLVHQVVTEVAEVLGINNIDAISLDIGFTDLGLDSLSSVELRNRLQTTLHCNLPSTLTYEFPTITSLVEYLVKKLNLSSVNQGKTLTTISNIPDKAEITNLSEAEAEALLLAELDNFTDLR
ncbi:MAG TPA: SDR family NAD(P)-dependent oxidoreductase, partial [Xenococcaceae cyanobacterium]